MTSTRDDVLTMLRRGTPVAQIMDATTWPRANIKTVAAKAGLLVDPTTDVAYAPDASAIEDAAETVKAMTVDELLTQASRCDAPKVRTARSRAEAAIDALRQRLADHAAGAVRAQVEEQARAEALERIERLERELADARRHAQDLGARPGRRRQTRQGTKKAGASGQGRRFWPGKDYDPRSVRAWARARDLQVPKVGPYLPDTIVERYLTAQQTENERRPAA